ncbi:12338_t:CDS:2 [Acaulospora colombiana]|uniref:12338_t:CDS:1 n=1 Tax=Acaulospora colombiana TaxID=27376 RepID=A0ACA9PI92_9GLOM|nr:12338_t:CDS:2 [Acaulospora colombiana]
MDWRDHGQIEGTPFGFTDKKSEQPKNTYEPNSMVDPRTAPPVDPPSQTAQSIPTAETGVKRSGNGCLTVSDLVFDVGRPSLNRVKTVRSDTIEAGAVGVEYSSEYSLRVALRCPLCSGRNFTEGNSRRIQKRISPHVTSRI